MTTLTGKDADRFLKKMLKKEVSPITKKEIKISEDIKKNFMEGELCSKCGRMIPKEEIITYANSFLDYNHGFSQRICNDCYKEKEKSSPWFKRGYNQAIKDFEKKLDFQKWIEQEPLRGNSVRHTERHLTAIHNNQLNELKQQLQKMIKNE